MESRQIYLSRELVKRGYDVTVFASTANHQLLSRPTKLKDTIDGIHIRWIDNKPYKNPYGFGRIWSWIAFEWKLWSQLKTTNFQNVSTIVVSSLSLLSILNGVYLKKKYKAKLVFEIRDIWPLIMTELTSTSKYHPLYIVLSWIEKWGYKHADLIVGTMPNLQEHVQSVSKSKRTVIQIPHLINNSFEFDKTHIYQTRLQEIRDLGFKEIIAYSGNISTSAGLDYILKCAGALAKEKIAIVILSEGPLKSHYMEVFGGDNIFYFDKIPQKQVVAFLKGCDILYDSYLKSSIYKFGSSRNKYVEYCLAEKPIVVSYGGYPLFVEEYNCGFVIEPENTNAIINAVKNLSYLSSTEKEIYGINAKKYAEKYLNISPQIDTLLEELENVK